MGETTIVRAFFFPPCFVHIEFIDLHGAVSYCWANQRPQILNKESPAIPGPELKKACLVCIVLPRPYLSTNAGITPAPL